MLRYFRPARIVQSSDLTWLVDECWPVAAAIGTDGSMTLVGWPWPQARVDPERDHVAVADGVGIVVRDGEQVVWVRRDECTIGQIEATLWLTAADPTTAWFVDRSYVDPGDPPASPPPLPPGRIVAAHRDGSRTDLPAAAPVNTLVTRHGQVWVTIAKPPIAHPGGYGSWDFEYPTSVLRAERAALLTGGLTAAVPVPASDLEVEDVPYAWTWLEDDPETVLQCGVRVNGLVWWAGAPVAGDYINRHAQAIGYDPATGRPVVRADLGLGLVSDVRAIGHELWLTVQRQRSRPASADYGVDVLAVSADGVVRTVQPADSIDISHFAPPLHQPTQEEVREQIDRVRRMFDHLDGYWSSEDGATSPLTAGLTGPSVTVEGDWPHTRVIVTFRHRRRPGLLLRRTLPIFDDEGLPVDHEYAGIYLMEDLDTDHIAPAGDAIDGVLDT